jgi:hypothetical protein
MSYPQRLASIDTVRAVLTEGPIRLRFPELGRKTMLLDSLTASAIVAVYDALSAEHQLKLAEMLKSPAKFMRVVDFAFKNVKGVVAK